MPLNVMYCCSITECTLRVVFFSHADVVGEKVHSVKAAFSPGVTVNLVLSRFLPEG